jgi:hypothetical protein
MSLRHATRSLAPLAATLAMMSIAQPSWAAGPTAADVGDADSFDKELVWVGLAQTGTVTLAASCAAPDPLRPDDRCVVLNPPGTSTTFSFADLGRVKLPKKTLGTLVCHWATPIIIYTMQNTGASPVFGNASFRSIYRIESSVLDDPALIDPTTGLPFGGAISASITATTEAGQVAAGDSRLNSVFSTRTCIGGLLTLASLQQTYGLSETSAKAVLNGPVTIRVGIAGNVRQVVSGTALFGVRFTTDRK